MRKVVEANPLSEAERLRLPGIELQQLSDFEQLVSDAQKSAQWMAGIARTPQGQGWLRVAGALEGLRADPIVQASPAAAEFVELMLEVSQDSLSSSDLGRALRPLESAMTSIRNAGYAAGPRLSPTCEELAAFYIERELLKQTKIADRAADHFKVPVSRIYQRLSEAREKNLLAKPAKRVTRKRRA